MPAAKKRKAKKATMELYCAQEKGKGGRTRQKSKKKYKK